MLVYQYEIGKLTVVFCFLNKKLSNTWLPRVWQPNYQETNADVIKVSTV
jgi:hypothetical protein